MIDLGGAANFFLNFGKKRFSRGGVRNFSITSLSYALVFARSNETICHLHALKCIIRHRQFEKCLNFVDSVLLPHHYWVRRWLVGQRLAGKQASKHRFRSPSSPRPSFDDWYFPSKTRFQPKPWSRLGTNQNIPNLKNQPNTRFMFQNQTLNHETLIRWRAKHFAIF